MGENIAILLVFFIILGIVIIFYGAYKVGDIQETQREQFEKEAIRVALITTYLPELACTDDNHLVENCFDIEKMEILSELVTTSDEYLLLYQNEFKNSKIYIDLIYPGMFKVRPGDNPMVGNLQRGGTFVIYDRPVANYTDIIPTFVPVAIRDPKRPFGQQYSFGMLTVEVYR